jgi:hypothetical protein
LGEGSEFVGAGVEEDRWSKIGCVHHWTRARSPFVLDWLWISCALAGLQRNEPS